MANTKVEIRVAVKTDAKDVYLVGSTASLGAWDAKKAVKLDYCEKCGKYTTAKMLPAGQTVEFKVLADKTWDAVEKGDAGYELANHSFIAEKGLVVEVEVVNFAK